MSTFLLGIDNGGTVIKGALYSLDGQEVAVVSRKLVMITPRPGHTERDSEAMWQANVAVIRELLEKTSVSGVSIIGIGITGHGNGVYLSDKAGKPTYNGVISTDTRGKDYVEQWQKDGTFTRTLLKTYNSIWAGQPAPILRWLVDHEPAVIAKTDYVFMCKDYIKYRLTGLAATEISDFSGGGMLNIAEKRLDQDLLKEFGIESLYDKLPPLKDPLAIHGYITKEIAELTGLATGTPVAGGTMDMHASAIATGSIQKDQLCVTAGTWSINEFMAEEPVISDDLFMCAIAPGNRYLIAEGSPTSASNLEWFLTEVLKGLEYTEGTLYDLANDLVASVPYDRSNLIFLPFLFGTNVDPRAKSAFVGMSAWHKRGHLIRAIYEGVVFSHRHHIDKLIAQGGNFKQARIAGGVVNSEIWMQMFADILQVPIEVTQTKELGAMGAAIIAGVSAGLFASVEVGAQRMIQVVKTCQPDQTKKALYDQKYQLYRNLLTKLAPIWQDFETVASGIKAGEGESL
ncbi:FGGY-family carbohydrate kinase [Vagococcus salmoninarum]|uniref:Carbohydrate kinase n=1 Tax=Vagococcus salmoninarum TaxID=2739 RepID=A0A429ZK09_9ENTE|nr:FGGY-family carbohydrate kinase [Vagococcus salmoninarum]RST94006.1 carbohydrate kinase [Vagococcus salmoninarum]